MANIAPAYVTINPSYTEPGILLPYSQPSGAFDLLADGQPLNRLGEGDLVVYMKRIDVRTKVGVGQTAYNELPSVSSALSMVSTPTYLLQVRAEYNHHDTAAHGQWGVSIVDVNRLGMRQGHFQYARTGLLYGFNPALGEGLLNANGATATTLPPDSNGNSTVVTYDNGQMGIFLLQVIAAIKTRTFQLGTARKITMLGPQRVFAAFQYYNIVQLTQFQAAGAGSVTTGGVVESVANMAGDEITWVYDDTLIGKGAGGTDAIVICMPEIKKPMNSARIQTNEFAKLAPGIEACTLMYSDRAAPTEIPTPLAGGAIDVLSEWRITSGWGVRPEAISVVSMQYS